MRFSVIICCYNNDAYISDAIWSVIANNDPDMEIVVVDDGSTDDSRAVIEGFTDPRVKAVFKENGGQASAFNAGVAASTGNVLCLLDGDDFFFPHKLATLRKLLKSDERLGSGPYMIRHPMTRVGADTMPERQHHGWGHNLYGWVQPVYGELIQLMEPNAVREHLRRYGCHSYAGGNASVFNRLAADLLFPLPEHLSKFYGDYFPVMASSLIGPVFLYGSELAAYRYHGSNHSSRRQPLVSFAFREGTDIYLNSILDKIGEHGLRADFFGSRLGVRYLAERDRGMESVRRAYGRWKANHDKRSLSDLFYSLSMSAAIRLGAVRPQTLHAND